ncbi:ribosomal protein S18 acetylase RimI-like enzyme [Crossiella equi]|uniref:Ribosomal protein S18 acetylase RimI-like enzyme n=1 Tax=Crossiella equi TaxID=130796 RepID=A0ABS5AL90_9PSEU|nr:GNAT family N-acetyltransferase [Crossiella equi]MBP2476994.1 ribosomal protein S18 acetylase RimI-like enzyme [Crossiella equi]
MSDGVSARFRRARAADVPVIVAMLAADKIAASREKPGDPAYAAAFEAIDSDPNQLLLVAEVDGEVVGTLQLTYLPGLSRTGMWRAQIEAVRVASHQRGGGLGQRMVEYAIEQAKAKGCGLVQLTTDASREHAIRFYERLGFLPSHVGMKLAL